MMSPVNKETDNRLTIKEFREFRFHPIVPIEDLKGLSGEPLADLMPYWRKHQLVPFIPKGAWNVEISFSQLIWLRILDHLRAIGYSVRDTQLVCDYFFKDAYFAELPTQNLQHRKNQLLIKERAGTMDAEDAAMLIEVERILNDPLLLYGLRFEINYLTELVSWCIEMGEEAGILVFADGKVMEKRGDHVSSHQSVGTLNEGIPHIYLSIRYFLQEFLQSEELEKIIVPYLLNENEKMVFREIRNKNVKELSIKFNGNTIIRIDSQEYQNITDDKAREIRKILGLHNYEEVNISTRDEKTLSFKRTKKQMLSD